MLKKIKTMFIRAAGWPEDYTVCKGEAEIKKIRRDIQEMQKLVEATKNIPRKPSLSLVKRVVSSNLSVEKQKVIC